MRLQYRFAKLVTASWASCGCARGSAPGSLAPFAAPPPPQLAAIDLGAPLGRLLGLGPTEARRRFFARCSCFRCVTGHSGALAWSPPSASASSSRFKAELNTSRLEVELALSFRLTKRSCSSPNKFMCLCFSLTMLVINMELLDKCNFFVSPPPCSLRLPSGLGRSGSWLHMAFELEFLFDSFQQESLSFMALAQFVHMTTGARSS